MINILSKKLGLNLVEDIEPVRNYTHYYMRPEYVTIHNAGSPWNGQRLHDYNRYSIKTSGDGVKSWHYSVGEDGAYQALPLTLNGWHAGDGNGDGNRKSISIEIARDLTTDRRLYDKAEDNGAKLAAILLNVFDLPLGSLRMHQDWSGKYCPHKILSEGRWQEFARRVQDYLRGLKTPVPDRNRPKMIYRLQLGAFGNLDNAEGYKQICADALKKVGVISDNPAEQPYIRAERLEE